DVPGARARQPCGQPRTRSVRARPGRAAPALRSVVRVRADGVVGGVDHLGDLGDGAEDRSLDALAQRHGGQRATVAAAAHRDVRGRAFDTHDRRVAAVRGDRRVHLLVEELADLLLRRAFELDRVTEARGRGPVRVAQHETALIRVRGQVERGAAQVVDAAGRYDDGQATLLVHVVVVGPLVERLEREVVGEVGAADAGDLDAQPEALRVFLGGTQLEDLGERL